MGETFIKVACDYCHKTFDRKASWEKYFIARGRKNKFCGNRCSHEFKKRRTVVTCCECKKEFEKYPSQMKHPRNFCSRRCSTIDKNRTRIGDRHPNWVNGASRYRERALVKYGDICNNIQCPFTLAGTPAPERMLDVHHKDENRGNNTIENLEVLCVWCHALKTRGMWSNGKTLVLETS